MLPLVHRPRRLRRTATSRALVAETVLRAEDFIHPCFVRSGREVEKPIASMPGVSQQSVDRLLVDLETLVPLGLKSVLLFGIPDAKDGIGSGGWDPEGPVPRAATLLKESFPDLVVMADVCLCEYTDHGHCGPLVTDEDSGETTVDNDAAVEGYVREALAYAAAGVDVVAPSGMMDGTVGAVRSALDASGYAGTSIMAYSAKFASGFYGPFREAGECAPKSGDRRSYQMDPANRREALREVRLDLEQGADIVMVKPALAYLDIISDVRAASDVPVAAYNVSGEYSMLKAAVEKGWLGEDAVWESLLAIKRAGADLIISYFTRDVLQRLARA